MRFLRVADAQTVGISTITALRERCRDLRPNWAWRSQFCKVPTLISSWTQVQCPLWVKSRHGGGQSTRCPSCRGFEARSYWFVLEFAATWVLTSTLNWTFDIGMTVAWLQGVKA